MKNIDIMADGLNQQFESIKQMKEFRGKGTPFEMPETDIDPACDTQGYAMAKERAIKEIYENSDLVETIIISNAQRIQELRYDYLDQKETNYTSNGRIALKAELANSILNLIDDEIENIAIDLARKEVEL